MLTIEALLRGGAPAINLYEGASVPAGLVLQLAHELSPTHIADTLGEAVVLEHVLDRQALDAHHLVFADNARRELVLVVPPPISDPGVDSGYSEPRPGTVPTAPLLPGEPPLRLCQLPLVRGEIPGIAHGLSCREDHHRGQAQVKPDHRLHRRERRDIFFDENGDKVAVGGVEGHGDGGRLRALGKRAAPAQSQELLHLGEGKVGTIPRKSRGGVFGRLLAALALEDGIRRTPLEEVLEGAVEMAQGLLWGDTRDLVQPGIRRLFLEGSEQSGGLVIGKRLLLLEVGLLSQAQEVVVDETSAAKGASKDPLLLARWIKAVFVGWFVFRPHRYLLLFFA